MMKKITKLLWGKNFMALFAIFLSVLSYGQCINSTQFGSAISNNSGSVQEIVGCTYSTEYNIINGLVVGENYIFTAETNTIGETPSPRYISITDASNVSIAHGMSPLLVNAITAATVRLHVSNDATCAGGSICHRTTVQFLADCPAPITLGVNTITTSGANVTWTPVGTETLWDLEYGIQGFTLGTGTLVTNIAATNYTLSGLNPGTNYQFYVRAKCSTEDSLWSTPFSFPTVCAAVTEFYENFDTSTASFGGPLPICWTKGGSVGNVYLQNGSGIPMSAPNGLFMFADSNNSIETYASMPLVSNLQANTHRLRFSAYGSTADRVIYLGYLTDANDVGTFQYLDEFALPTGGIAAASQFILVPGALPVGAQRLVFKNATAPAETSEIYIDDVRWEPIPTCTEPSNVVTTNVLATTTTVEWTAPTSAPANGYEYYLSTSNTVPTAATVATGSVGAGITTVGLTSLTPVTSYYVWVRSVCSTTSTSIWTLTATFTTPCASYVPYYLEDFSTFTFAGMPDCWKKYNDGDLATGPTGSDNTGSWNPDTMMNGTGNTAAKINLFNTFPKGWLVSPIFDLTAGGYQVKYNVGTTQWNTTNPINAPGVMGSDDVVQFLMSTDGGTTWTALETYDSSNTPGNTVATEIYNIPAITSNAVKFAYYATAGTISDGTDYDFFVDNFIVQTIPTTVPACASNVVATINASCGNFPTVISWDATSGSDGYKLSIGTTSGGTDILNSQVLTTLNYTHTGSINTTYYYKVVPFNANGDAVSCTEQSFTTSATGCYCASEPTSVDGTGITNVKMGAIDVPISVSAAPYYSNQTATVYNMNQGISNNVQISFNTLTYNYNTYIYVDLNDNFTLEASELLFTGVSSSISPNVYDASFVMPATAPLGNHRMRIVTADFLPTPNPCYSSSYGFTVDFTINVQVPSCTPGAATATLSPDCANSQFSIAVDVTSLGSGSPSISDGTTTLPVTATGIVNVGPYANGASVVLTLLHGTDAICNVALGTFTYSCPPVNNECSAPIVLTAGGVFADNDIDTTNIAATLSAETPNPTCGSFGFTTSGKDVWYSVVVPASGSLTIETGVTSVGATGMDTVFSVYSGSCSSLNQVGCDDEGATEFALGLSKLSLTGLTAGETLLIRVFGYNGAQGNFSISAYDASLGNGSFDSSNFTFYPNPVKDVLNLSYSQNINKVQVINILGQEVKTETMDASQAQVDMSNLPQGTYLVKVTSGNDVKTIKVIKE